MKQGTLVIRAVIVLMLVAILAYMGLSGLKTLTNPYKTVVVYNDVVEESLTVNSWLFRDEQRLPSATGLVNYAMDEGERVGGGQTVAVAYQNQEALYRQQRVWDLAEQFAQLEYAIDDESPSGKNLEDQTLNTYTQMMSSVSRGDFSQVESQTNQYKQMVLRREYPYTDTAAAEMGMGSLSLSQELGILQ